MSQDMRCVRCLWLVHGLDPFSIKHRAGQSETRLPERPQRLPERNVKIYFQSNVLSILANIAHVEQHENFLHD